MSELCEDGLHSFPKSDNVTNHFFYLFNSDICQIYVSFPELKILKDKRKKMSFVECLTVAMCYCCARGAYRDREALKWWGGSQGGNASKLLGLTEIERHCSCLTPLGLRPPTRGGWRGSSVAGAKDDYENEDNRHNSQC